MTSNDTRDLPPTRHPLEEADAAARIEIILGMIEADPESRLVVPELASGRLNLQELRLNHLALGEHAVRLGNPPSWWHPEGRPQFRAASFRGADLQGADFSGTDLTGTDFSGVIMRNAVLRKARLDGADLHEADLSGSDFMECLGNEGNFSEALLEDAQFTGATLRFANFAGALLDGANLTKADLWGGKMQGADATDANMKEAVLQEASLEGASLSGANLQDAELKNVNFSGATMRNVDLRGATVVHANFENADLSGASLPRVDLSTCNLTNVRLSGAWLENTRFRVDQLGGAVGEEAAGEFEAARQAYLALEQNFRTLGNPEAASWTFRKARRMGKRHSLALLKAAWRGRRLREAVTRCFEWSGDVFAEWLCDYGESLPRVLRAFVTTLVCFAVVFGVTGSLRYSTDTVDHLAGAPVRNPFQLMGFSFLTMCTAVAPDFDFKPSSHEVYFLASTEYVLGLVLIGLFGYVLGNRLRR